MRRSTVLILLCLVTLAAAAVAALHRPQPIAATPPSQPPDVSLTQSTTAPPSRSLFVSPPVGPLAVTAQLERKWLNEGTSAPYVQIDVTALGAPSELVKAPVNAVLVIDRSGSMAGEKIVKAREAARALIKALDGEDRLSIIDFASDARVLLPSIAMTANAKEQALALVSRLMPTSGTNFSGAFAEAAPQLRAGRAMGRVDKVFLASDGMVNEGVVARGALLSFAQRSFEGATLSTFGVGADYDEELMESLAAQAGGRARFIDQAGMLATAFGAELTRASSVVAREVKLTVQGASGAVVEQVFGYEVETGSVRLPDFAAGETRRILARLRVPGGHGEAELVRVRVACVDARGKQFAAAAGAGGTFTAQVERLREAPRQAAAEGAKAEMAQLARRAMVAFEQGNAAQGQHLEAAIDGLSERVAKDLPAAAPAMAAQARDWRSSVDKGALGGRAEKKAMKQKAFDALRAPTAGW